jgi:hypothetical protein
MSMTVWSARWAKPPAFRQRIQFPKGRRRRTRGGMVAVMLFLTLGLIGMIWVKEERAMAV